MTGADWAVIAAAAAAIGAVNWYFLGRPQVVASAVAAAGIERAVVRIEGGYTPDVVEVRAGRPVQLTFDRRENNPCSDEVVIGALGIRRELPPFNETTIELSPLKPGRYEFTCGMGMLHGAIVAS
jgi:plastocyanin domain-containing protein